MEQSMFHCGGCGATFVLTVFETANDLRRPYLCPFCGSPEMREHAPQDAHKLKRKVGGYKR